MSTDQPVDLEVDAAALPPCQTWSAAGRRQLTAVRDAQRGVDEAMAALGRAAQAREVAVREALAAGVGATEIAQAAGIHRRRVYQIRDGVR